MFRRGTDRGLSNKGLLLIFGIIVAIGVLLVAAVVGVGVLTLAADSGGSSSGGGSAGGDGGSAGTPTPNPRAHELGDSFVVGSGNHSLEWTVTDVAFDDAGDSTTITVKFNATNVGTETATIDSSTFSVADDQDRVYEPTDMTVAGQGGDYQRDVGPGFDAQGVVYFQVPSDGDNRRLRIEPAGVFSTADRHFVELE